MQGVKRKLVYVTAYELIGMTIRRWGWRCCRATRRAAPGRWQW